MGTERDGEVDRALSQLLRRGDPAADGRAPGAAEIARLRANVVAAARAPRAARAWTWAGAAVAAAAVLAAVAILVPRPGSVRTASPTGPPRSSRRATPEPEGSAGVPATRDGEALTDAAAGAARKPLAVAAARGPDVGPVRGASAVEDGEPGPTRTPRQIQFTGARGTRILWTLDPAFRL